MTRCINIKPCVPGPGTYRCAVSAMRGSDWCWFHDPSPEMVAKRQESFAKREYTFGNHAGQARKRAHSRKYVMRLTESEVAILSTFFAGNDLWRVES